MGSLTQRLTIKVLAVSLLMGALFFAATVVQQRQEAAERQAQVQAAIDAGVLAPPPAWRPAERPELIDWLKRLAAPLLKLEGQESLAGRGASASGPPRAATASYGEVLAEVQALLSEAPTAPWILGAKVTDQGWHQWAGVMQQLPGLGPAGEREVQRLIEAGEGAAALGVMRDLLLLLQGLGGYDYSQNETIAITEESVLAAAQQLLEPGAEGDLDRASWLALVEGQLAPLIDSGLAWAPYQRRLVRVFDAGLTADRSQVRREGNLSANTKAIGLGAELLIRSSAADATKVVPYLSELGFRGLEGVMDLVASYAACLCTQRRYAFLRAAIQVCEQASETGVWPGANSGPTTLDPLTKKPFQWTVLEEHVRLSGEGWDLHGLTLGRQRAELVWVQERH